MVLTGLQVIGESNLTSDIFCFCVRNCQGWFDRENCSLSVLAPVVTLASVIHGSTVVAVTPVLSPTCPSCPMSGCVVSAAEADSNIATLPQKRIGHRGPHSDLRPIRRRQDLAFS